MVQDAHLDCLTQHSTASIHSCSTPAGRNLSCAEDSSRLRATRPALESLCELGFLTHSQLSQGPLGGGTSSFCLTHLTTVPGLYSILNPPRVSIFHRARLYGQSSITSLKPP